MLSRMLYMSELRDGIAHTKGRDAMMNPDDVKPLVSFCLIAYNQEKFVRQAIESALAQTYRPIQFIFSDDCSTDRSFEIMREMAELHQGKENILLNRNEKNLGIVDHLNRIFFEFTKGKYLVLLAGDDITSPDRTGKVVSLFEATRASAIAVNPVMIDENGSSAGNRFFPVFPTGHLYFEEFFEKGARFFGGGGYAREIFDTYGPMKNSARNEDRILSLRATTLGGIAYLSDPVYFYREHGNNMSFWVKMKRDPQNKAQYALAARRNQLQNMENFMQEVRDCYPGLNKEKLLAQINGFINTLNRMLAEPG
jgi:glycosyltransferase involved in cell wall biosynthesis